MPVRSLAGSASATPAPPATGVAGNGWLGFTAVAHRELRGSPWLISNWFEGWSWRTTGSRS